MEYLNQDDKRNQKLKVIIDQIFNCVLSPKFVTQTDYACWVFENMNEIKFGVFCDHPFKSLVS